MSVKILQIQTLDLMNHIHTSVKCVNYFAAVIFILIISRKSDEICLMGDTTLLFKNKSDFRWECPSVPPMKGYVQETGNIHTPHNLQTHTHVIFVSEAQSRLCNI